MFSSHHQAAGERRLANVDGPSPCLLREAEFAVASAISVREQQKTRLLDMVAELPSLLPQAAHSKVSRQVAPIRRGQTTSTLNLHLIGDLLLLLRAASVNVVERVEAWRHHLHQGQPRPYLYENRNYLLVMCQDTDFLDSADVLVEWLGFSLRRNPFITKTRSCQFRGRPDSRSETESGVITATHLPTLHPRRGNESKTRSVPAQRAKRSPSPPPSLVLPLASIMPCDNAVDGERVAAAQRALVQEESLHGNMMLLRTARKCIESCKRLKAATETLDEFGDKCELSLCDKLAALNIMSRRVEQAVSRVQMTLAKARRALAELDDHVRWIESCRQVSSDEDQHIWHCQNQYRTDTLRLCAGLFCSLREALEQLHHSLEQLQATATAQNQLARTLEQEKNRVLQARKLLQNQQRHQKPMKSEPTKRSMYSKRVLPLLDPVAHSNTAKYVIGISDISKLGDPIDVAVATTLHERHTQVSQDIEKKRTAAIDERAALLREKAILDAKAQAELDSRRAESALMKSEDDASRTQQRLMESRRQLKERRALLDRISATAIFKCPHTMNGKTFLISVYDQKPHGYILEGIRIAAYYPSTSASFSLTFSLREFDSYGYGRSPDGLREFCKSLCLLYEKRDRRFRLVWVGALRPPPLRIRDYDHTLICAHKEGVRLGGRSGFALVAVYTRLDMPDSLRFVCGSLLPRCESLVERLVPARHLFVPDDFKLLNDDTTGITEFVTWRHLRGVSTPHHVRDAGNHGREHFSLGRGDSRNECHHVRSGTIVVDGVRVDAHVYDANSKFIIDFGDCASAKDPELSASVSEKAQRRQVTLLKSAVNPYPLDLPLQSFDDLLACVTIETTDTGTTMWGDPAGTSFTMWRAIVSPKWTKYLAKYVRALRLAKFGCKIAGVFCLATVFLVQLKTEYRSHLLLELTPMRTSSKDGDRHTKQSHCISLSSYLHCRVAMRRLGFINDLDECRGCVGDMPACPFECESQSICGDAQHHETTHGIETELYGCPGCLAAQNARVGALRDILESVLLEEGTEWSQESLNLSTHVVHQEHCDACGISLPPLLAVVSSEFSSHPAELKQLLERYYLLSFDCSKLVLHSGNGIEIRCEESIADDFKNSASCCRVTVLLNAEFGFTVAGANSFANELRALVYPHDSELPFQTVFVKKARGAIASLQSRCDREILASVAAMCDAARQIAESVPTFMGDTGAASDAGLGFEAYLVSEALLIEALRVVLEPHLPWKPPGGTVGSSSWPVACELLQNPQRLSTELELQDVLAFGEDTRNLLTAYFSHAHWPRSYGDVRPIFHTILAFMMHVEYVYHLLAKSGGLLAHANSHSEASAEHDRECHLHSQMSVLLLGIRE